MFDRQDSACSLQWTIQMKDKQIAVISEKLNAHLALFSSVGKEVAAVKQVLGNVKCLVGDKENVGMQMAETSYSTIVLPNDCLFIFYCTNVHSLDTYLCYVAISVSDLKGKVEKISVLEKDFVGMLLLVVRLQFPYVDNDNHI